jgi:hypothetical protein
MKEWLATKVVVVAVRRAKKRRNEGLDKKHSSLPTPEVLARRRLFVLHTQLNYEIFTTPHPYC